MSKRARSLARARTKRHRSSIHWPRRAWLAFACLAPLAACGTPGSQQTGIRIGDETLEKLEGPKSTSEWLITLIGEPTSRSYLPSDPTREVLRYVTTEKSGGVFSFFTGKSERNTGTVYFIVDDGMLIDFWADRETERTLFGKEVEKDTGEKEQ